MVCPRFHHARLCAARVILRPATAASRVERRFLLRDHALAELLVLLGVETITRSLRTTSTIGDATLRTQLAPSTAVSARSATCSGSAKSFESLPD